MGDFLDTEQTEKLSLSTWKKLIPFVTPLKKHLIFVMAMMILSAVVDSIIPLFTRYAVNNFVIPGSTAGIGRFSIVYASVIILQAVSTILYSRQAMIIEMNMSKIMKHECFHHLQKLPLSFYNKTSVGYILARVMSDTSRISGMIAWVGSTFVWYFFYLLGIIIFMCILNLRMALIALSILPVLIVITLVFQPKLLRANRKMRHNNSRITSSFNENINGAKTSKTLCIEDKLAGEFSDITSDMYNSSMHVTRLNAVYMPIISFFGSLSISMILWYSGAISIQGALDLGMFSSFMSYAIALLDPISHVAQFYSEIMAAQVNVERVATLLAEPVTVSDSPEIESVYGDLFNPIPENYPAIQGDIEFRNVWFRYPDANEDNFVLENINLKVKAGTTVAIVGETGAGKSTLVNLACRFFEPTKGEIFIDGSEYRERSLNWLHSNLGYVQQNPHLFSGTLADNIRYGKLDATEEELLRAASLVSVDKVAQKFENGFETDVGEGGDKLSTGEKQLISFARALIADPPIFVLDEATSSIDTETEVLIQDAISKVLTNRTSFIIAHRLSTIRNADLILLIDGRGIKEMGSHGELMAQEGAYFRLYTAMMIEDEYSHEGFSLRRAED